MTPAERDEVRMVAQIVIDAIESSPLERMMGRAVLRYVPPGEVAPSLLSARVNVNGAITFDGGICTAESARRIAAEFNAAADAAEES